MLTKDILPDPLEIKQASRTCPLEELIDTSGPERSVKCTLRCKLAPIAAVGEQIREALSRLPKPQMTSTKAAQLEVGVLHPVISGGMRTVCEPVFVAPLHPVLGHRICHDTRRERRPDSFTRVVFFAEHRVAVVSRPTSPVTFPTPHFPLHLFLIPRAVSSAAIARGDQVP